MLIAASEKMLRDRLRGWEVNTKLKRATSVATSATDVAISNEVQVEPTRDLNTSAENVYQRHFLNNLDGWYNVSWRRKQMWATEETPSSAMLVDFAEVASIAIAGGSPEVSSPSGRRLIRMRPLLSGHGGCSRPTPHYIDCGGTFMPFDHYLHILTSRDDRHGPALVGWRTRSHPPTGPQ